MIAMVAIGITAVAVWRYTGKVPSPQTARDGAGGSTAADNGSAAVVAAAERFNRDAKDAASSQQALDILAGQIAALPRDVASRALRELLRTGKDHRTGIDFKPDGRGGLAGSSSLRVFLLDQLRKLDPEQARGLARSILSQHTSPDEWALSLAILGTATDDTSRQIVRQKSRELALHEPWQTTPTAGFLEAFDVFVHNRDTEFVPQLSAFLNRTNNQALAHAAFLTLDRLVQAAPVATLESLLKNPALLSSREATRAGYFARADVRDPAQLAVLEQFLTDPAFANPERERFLAGFPSANFMVSQNLLTTSATPGGPEIAARDQASLKVLNDWIVDPRFTALKPALESSRDRLSKFVPPPR